MKNSNLLKRIEALEKRVEILEKQAAAVTATNNVEVVLDGKVIAHQLFPSIQSQPVERGSR